MTAEYKNRLENFSAIHNRLDQFIFIYGQSLLLLCMVLSCVVFLFGGKNMFGWGYTLRWFDLVTYLYVFTVAIIGVIASRDYFVLIPNTFRELVQRRLIKNLNTDPRVKQNFSTFLQKFETRLNLNIPVLLLPIIIVGTVLAMITSSLLPLSNKTGCPTWAILINFITVLIPISICLYAALVFAWKCLITGFALYQFCEDFELSLQPSHPDKASGFKPFGDLVFSMALLLIIASVASSILVVFAEPTLEAMYAGILKVASDPSTVYAPPFMVKTILTANAFLGVTLVLSLVVFFIPLIRANMRMKREKEILMKDFTRSTNKIAELERQARLPEISHTKRDAMFQEIDSITKSYTLVNKMPEWPFDRELLFKFLTPQIASLLSFLGVVQPIVDFISSLFK